MRRPRAEDQPHERRNLQTTDLVQDAQRVSRRRPMRRSAASTAWIFRAHGAWSRPVPRPVTDGRRDRRAQPRWRWPR